MHRTPIRVALLSLATAALLLAGCGTSSGSDASEDPTTTAAEKSTTTATDDATTTEAEAPTTTEADGPTTTVASGDGICAPLKALAASDAEANALVAGGNWPEIQAFYVDQTDDIVAIYDEAIAFDTEITPELETLREVTVSSGDLAAESSDLMEFSSKLIAQPGLTESGTAALAASAFSEETCGFPLVTF